MAAVHSHRRSLSARATMSMSTAHLAPPPSSSMVDSLPEVNINFEDLRQRMNAFTARFDAFIARGRKQILEERNKHRLDIAELEEEAKLRQRAIASLEKKSAQHNTRFAKEEAEIRDLNVAIESLSDTVTARRTQRERLRTEIAAMKSRISARQNSQSEYEARQAAQMRQNEPELRFWTEKLGLSIEGTGQDDRLRFVFRNVDPKDTKRECVFELDMAGLYKVSGTAPALEKEDVERVVGEMNERRDLARFLKEMRGLFVGAVKK